MKTSLLYKSGMTFESKTRNHTQVMDAKADFGGQDLGPSPKEMLLSAIAGCSAMDVVSLLKKMRMDFTSFEITSEAETTESHPKVFKEVLLGFHFIGQALDYEKIRKSIEMSLTKYCGVSAMVNKVSPIRFEIFLNKEKKGEGLANFGP